MNTGRFWLVFLGIAFLALTSQANQYFGELNFAWTNDTYQTSGQLKIGVTHIGDGHYLASGKIIKLAPAPTETVPVYGNAEIIDGQVHLTISFVGNGGTESLRAILQPGTLSGIFKGVGIYGTIDNYQGSMWLLNTP